MRRPGWGRRGLVPAAAALAALLCAGFPAFGADAVTIGLLVPAESAVSSTTVELRRGVRIAVEEAQAGGGIAGRPLRLVEAGTNGPWDGVTRAVARLVFDEGAAAVVGALDGRSGHAAEQVIVRARGQALFVTPWASETTLTRIRVPWFFSVAPDDRLQAARLVEGIFSVRDIRRVAAWVEDGFDSGSAAAEFEAAAPRGAVTRFQAAAPSSTRMLEESLARGDTGAVVLFASPGRAAELLRSLHERGLEPPLFGPLGLATPEFAAAAGPLGRRVLVVAPDERGSGALEFARAYRRTVGSAPTAPAMYAHDAVAAIVLALREAAARPGRSVEEALAAIRFDGVTGPVRLDEHRSRGDAPGLVPAAP